MRGIWFYNTSDCLYPLTQQVEALHNRQGAKGPILHTAPSSPSDSWYHAITTQTQTLNISTISISSHHLQGDIYWSTSGTDKACISLCWWWYNTQGKAQYVRIIRIKYSALSTPLFWDNVPFRPFCVSSSDSELSPSPCRGRVQFQGAEMNNTFEGDTFTKKLNYLRSFMTNKTLLLVIYTENEFSADYAQGNWNCHTCQFHSKVNVLAEFLKIAWETRGSAEHNLNTADVKCEVMWDLAVQLANRWITCTDRNMVTSYCKMFKSDVCSMTVCNMM